MKKQTTIQIRVEDAIKHFGTAAELARSLGVTRQAITSWGHYMPELRAYKLKDMYPRDFKALTKQAA